MHKIGDSSESSKRMMWNIFSFYTLIWKCRLKICAQSLFQEFPDLFDIPLALSHWKTRGKLIFRGNERKEREKKSPEMKQDQEKKKKGEQEGRVQIDTSKCQNFISVAFVPISIPRCLFQDWTHENLILESSSNFTRFKIWWCT